jgi:hypothetical protein
MQDWFIQNFMVFGCTRAIQDVVNLYRDELVVDASGTFMTYTVRHRQKNTLVSSAMKVIRKMPKIIDNTEMVSHFLFFCAHASTGFAKDDRLFQRPKKNLTSLDGVLFQKAVIRKTDIGRAISKYVAMIWNKTPNALPPGHFTNTSVRKMHSDILDFHESMPASMVKKSLGHSANSDSFRSYCSGEKAKAGQK